MPTARKTKHANAAASKTASRRAAANKRTVAPKRAPKRAPKPTKKPVKPTADGKRAAPAGTTRHHEQLDQQRAHVQNELLALRAELQEAPEMTGDEVDLNVYEREKTLGLVAAYERRLEEINATMQAAQRGQYGICERCGNPIDPERLKIFPETRLCVSCKNQVEREQRRLRT